MSYDNIIRTEALVAIESMGATAFAPDSFVATEHEGKALEELVTAVDATNIDSAFILAESCQLGISRSGIVLHFGVAHTLGIDDVCDTCRL